MTGHFLCHISPYYLFIGDNSYCSSLINTYTYIDIYTLNLPNTGEPCDNKHVRTTTSRNSSLILVPLIHFFYAVL